MTRREYPEQRRARVKRERAAMTVRCVKASRDEARWTDWHRNDLSTFKMPYDYPRQWPNRRMRRRDNTLTGLFRMLPASSGDVFSIHPSMPLTWGEAVKTGYLSAHPIGLAMDVPKFTSLEMSALFPFGATGCGNVESVDRNVVVFRDDRDWAPGFWVGMVDGAMRVGDAIGKVAAVHCEHRSVLFDTDMSAVKPGDSAFPEGAYR